MKEFNVEMQLDIFSIMEIDEYELQKYVKQRMIQEISRKTFEYIDENKILNIEEDDKENPTSVKINAEFLISTKDEMMDIVNCITEAKKELISIIPEDTHTAINKCFNNIIEYIVSRID